MIPVCSVACGPCVGGVQGASLVLRRSCVRHRKVAHGRRIATEVLTPLQVTYVHKSRQFTLCLLSTARFECILSVQLLTVRCRVCLLHAPRCAPVLPRILERFSAPEVRGELPKSGAICLDHPICRGIIFADNQQAISHDKGEIIAEYAGLLLHNARRAVTEHVGTGASGDGSSSGSSSGGGGGGGSVSSLAPSQRPRKCVLVDNTSRKCEKAMETFGRHAALAGGGLELHAIHYTEAENLVDSPDALRQLRIILARLRARGLVGVDLVAEDILVKAPAPTLEPKGKGGRGGRGNDERLKRA